MVLKELFNSPKEQQEYIAQLIGTTHDWYCVTAHKQGLHVLSQLVENDDQMFERLASDKVFWGWWTNHYNSWDASFIQWYNFVLDKPMKDDKAIAKAYNNHHAAFIQRQYMIQSFDNLKGNIINNHKSSKQHGKTKDKKGH